MKSGAGADMPVRLLMKSRFNLLVSDDWRDYQLLDSGDGRKLERFGRLRFNRPDPQTLWSPQRPVASWGADAVFASKDEEDERGAWSFPGTPPPRAVANRLGRH